MATCSKCDYDDNGSCRNTNPGGCNMGELFRLKDGEYLSIFDDLGLDPETVHLRLLQGHLCFEHEGDVYYTPLNADGSLSLDNDDWGVVDTFSISEEEFAVLNKAFPFIVKIGQAS